MDQNQFPILLPDKIKIIDIVITGPGIEPEKDSLFAFFPASITWCDLDIDVHVAKLDESLQQRSEIHVCYWSKNVSTGIYEIYIPKEYERCSSITGKIFMPIAA